MQDSILKNKPTDKQRNLVRKIFHIIIFFLLLIGLTSSHANNVRVLTLEECISLALKNNDSLKASLSEIDMHKYATRISHSELFPKFGLNAQYAFFDKEPTFIIGKNAFSPGIPASNIELPAGEKEIYALAFSIKQPVFTGGYLTNRYESAQIQEKVSETQSKNVEFEIIQKIKSAYYDLLKTLKIKEIQEHIIKEKEERRRITEERQREGVANNEEVLLVKADTAKRKLELLKTENEIVTKGKTLKNLMGIDPDADVAPADRLENKKLLIGLSESKDIAIKNRKDLLRFQYIIKSAEKEISVAESSFYPKSFIVGSYTRQRETPLTKPDLWALMLTLNWDIFEWGKTSADVNRAKARYEKLSSEYNALKKDVLLDVEKKWFGVKEAEEGVKASKDKLIYAEERCKNASLKYSENLIKTAELLDAETYLVQSRNEYINSIYDLNVAVAEFEFSTASDIEPFLIKEEIYKTAVPIIEIGVKNPISIKTDPPHPPLTKGGQEGGKTDSVNPDRYAVQVGAFKHADLADKLIKKLKATYPDAYVEVVNNFNKVRIPGIKTKEEGALIMIEIEKNFKVKPILFTPKKRRLTTESTEEYFDIKKKKTCSIAFLCALIKCKFI